MTIVQVLSMFLLVLASYSMDNDQKKVAKSMDVNSVRRGRA